MIKMQSPWVTLNGEMNRGKLLLSSTQIETDSGKERAIL